jgi:hemerythrin-like domain-containing protein
MQTHQASSTQFHPLLSQLITDHKNLARLLNNLEDQFRLYILDTSDQHDEDSMLPAMLETMEYLSVYPEKWHHPAEELIFETLIKKDITKFDKESITNIKEQHVNLEKRSNLLKQTLLSIANDTVLPAETLIEQFSSFMGLQREHLENENELIFPLLINKIKHKEWDEVGKILIPSIDPLFKNRSKNEYRVLSTILQKYKQAKKSIHGQTKNTLEQ